MRNQTAANVDVPAEHYRAKLATARLPDWLADSLVALSQAIRDGHTATVTNNVERVIEGDEIVKSIHALTTELTRRSARRMRPSHDRRDARTRAQVTSVSALRLR